MESGATKEAKRLGDGMPAWVVRQARRTLDANGTLPWEIVGPLLLDAAETLVAQSAEGPAR